jgi:acyl-CoA synthetase (AMP-forming)/AMP-acid ligase II
MPLSKKRELSNITEFLNIYLKKNKEKIFYMSEFKKKQISYSKLFIIIKNFLIIISKFKLNPQDKIMIICDNSENLVLIFLSILYHKLIFVPVNPSITRIELDYILKKTNPKLIITNKLLAKKLKIKNSLYLIESYEKIKTLNINTLHNKNKIYSKNKDLISQILFTSGSTGNPKGVILTHQSMLHNLYGIFNSIKIKGKNLNFLSITPLYHNNGQFIPTLLPILIGGKTLSISPDSSLVNFWPICKKFKINYSSVMATHINYFNSFKKIKHNLKALFCGGAKLDIENHKIFEKKFNIKVLCNYGLTETSSIACTESVINRSYKYGSVGKPLFNNEIKILKKKQEKFGEIIIKGKNIFKEYLGDKKTTKKTKIGKWLHTGDLGYFDKKGFLYIKDRIDNMMLVSGENIYPSEIENVVYKFKKIRLGVVTSIPDKITQNKLILIYEANKKINYTEIYQFLSKKLSKYKIPKIILSCDEIGIKQIPKAANKKVLRKKLKLIVSELFK